MSLCLEFCFGLHVFSLSRGLEKENQYFVFDLHRPKLSSHIIIVLNILNDRPP
jgi:hypothetical protein